MLLENFKLKILWVTLSGIFFYLSLNTYLDWKFLEERENQILSEVRVVSDLDVSKIKINYFLKDSFYERFVLAKYKFNDEVSIIADNEKYTALFSGKKLIKINGISE